MKIIRHFPTNESSIISSSELNSTCCGELPAAGRLIGGTAVWFDGNVDNCMLRIWFGFINGLAVLLGKPSLCLVGGRFFFIWSWKLIISLGNGDDDDGPRLIFALDMLFLLVPLICDVFDSKLFAVAFTDECCNGDLFAINEENALFPLFKIKKI